MGVEAAPQLYMEKWKISKENGSSRKQSQRRKPFTRKCANLVKQQRARFYIMRRCVTMLICWQDCSDS